MQAMTLLRDKGQLGFLFNQQVCLPSRFDKTTTLVARQDNDQLRSPSTNDAAFPFGFEYPN